MKFENLKRFNVAPVEKITWRNFYVRSFSAAHRSKLVTLAKQFEKEDRQDQLNAYVAVFSCCDEQGKLMFTENDLDIVNEMNATDVDAIALAAMELNGLTPKSVDEQKKS